MTFKQFKKKMMRRQTESFKFRPKELLRFNTAHDKFAKNNMIISIISMVVVIAIIFAKPSDIVSLVVCAITLSVLVYSQYFSKGYKEVNSILKEMYEQVK